MRWTAPARYLNFTGTGNSVNMGEPRMVQFVMDSLRWWVQAFGVDGFRFDLAATLGRDPALHHQFNPRAALFTAMAQDPVLAPVKRIAEPWDVAPGGYQVGAFAPGWQEWNDRFRDIARMYWLGHECTPGQLARRMTGSDDLFAHDGRGPLASINMITAHDGFTLADVTAYRYRHNEANGEDNRDGPGNNFSANAGVEGPTQDAGVLRQRAAWRRALLATLLLAQGTPQLLAGDEMGNSQQGNNNAYCQDNPTSWLDWGEADEALISLVCRTGGTEAPLPRIPPPPLVPGPPVPRRRASLHSGRRHRLVASRWPGDVGPGLGRPVGAQLFLRDRSGRGHACCHRAGHGAASSRRVVSFLLAARRTVARWRSTPPHPSGASERTLSQRYELAGPAICVLVQAIESLRGRSAIRMTSASPRFSMRAAAACCSIPRRCPDRTAAATSATRLTISWTGW